MIKYFEKIDLYLRYCIYLTHNMEEIITLIIIMCICICLFCTFTFSECCSELCTNNTISIVDTTQNILPTTVHDTPPETRPIKQTKTLSLFHPNEIT